LAADRASAGGCPAAEVPKHLEKDRVMNDQALTPYQRFVKGGHRLSGGGRSCDQVGGSEERDAWHGAPLGSAAGRQPSVEVLFDAIDERLRGSRQRFSQDA